MEKPLEMTLLDWEQQQMQSELADLKAEARIMSSGAV